MTYFIPSYFQKRLLRYALSRLDIIETNDLDLDNLAITFGQRSVVELKNVALKIQRLVALASLPSHIVPDHATIRNLRITVPADLHVSGIVVEIDGVDIKIRFQDVESEPSDESKNMRSAPRHGDVTSRPRKTSHTVHDPGGVAGHGAQRTQHNHLLPTSEDLAVSFLETEPIPERRELEAVIGSQSHYMSSSTASTASLGHDDGLGLPGGFSLPTFVADFFQGVSDRLSVHIKNITLVVDARNRTQVLPQDGTSIVLRVKEVNLEGMNSPASAVNPSQRRSFTLHGIEVLLHSNATSNSKASSPRLTRTSTKLSSRAPSDLSSASDLGQSRSTPLGLNISTSHLAASEEERIPTPLRALYPQGSPSAVYGSSVDDFESFLSTQHPQSSQASSPSPDSTHFQSTLFHFGVSVDNQANAEKVLHSGQLGTNDVNSVAGDDEETPDLAQSKVFTHEDAESMYMSAVAEDVDEHNPVQRMPGAWDWEPAESTTKVREQLSEPPPRTHENTKETSGTSSKISQMPFQEWADDEASTAPIATGHAVAAQYSSWAHEHSGEKCEYKRVLEIDRMRVQLPGNIFDVDEIPQRQQPALSAHPPDMSASRPGQQSGAASVLEPSFSRFRPQRESSGYKPQELDAATSTAVDVGNIDVYFDMGVMRCIVELLQYLPKRPPSQDQSSPPGAAKVFPSISLKLGVIRLSAYEQMSAQYLSEITAETVTDTPEVPMLCTTLSNLAFSSRSAPAHQQVTITNITVQHMGAEIMSFIDSLNVRDSIATSTMLRPHDLTLSASDSRVEIYTKPVHIKLDLLVIDDVLSRSGGLSTLLDLGASIASVSTVKGTTVQNTSTRRRTVRFDAPGARPRADSGSGLPGSKINVRLSGALIDLIGSQSTIKVKTAAVKMAYRGEIARVAVDGAALEGPWIHGAHMEPAMFAKVKAIDVVYRNTPDEEQDLERLLSLITPSKNEYDNDDDIMIDTLLSQRRKGAVVRLSISDIQASVHGFGWQSHLGKLAEELGKLSSVTKYLPEDDRPGMLTFVLINKVKLRVNASQDTSPLQLSADLLEGAHINVPSLLALQLSKLALTLGEKETLAGEVVEQSVQVGAPPMLMCRFIADEMEPTVRLKLSNLCLEYKVSTLLALKELAETVQSQLGGPNPANSPLSSPVSSETRESSPFSRKVAVSVAIADSAVALYPTDLPAKGLLLLSDTTCTYRSHRKQIEIISNIQKASLLIIDDVAALGHTEGVDHRLYFDQNDQVQQLTKAGFVPLTSLSSAVIQIKLHEATATTSQLTDVEIRNGLLFLETCADSTQTLSQILGGLSPPGPPSVIAKYRTEIVPIEDMLASFTGDAYVAQAGAEMGMQASQLSARTTATDSVHTNVGLQASQMSTKTTSTQSAESELDVNDEIEDDPSNFGFMDPNDDDMEQEDDDRMTETYAESEMARSTASGSVHIAPVVPSVTEDEQLQQSMMVHSLLDFRSDHFQTTSTVGGTAHKWDLAENTYGLSSEKSFNNAPLKGRLRDCHVIWNLYDGYDWARTRDRISQAVKDLEAKAMIRRPTSLVPGVEGEEEAVIGDFLFNSIYIGIPANKDPRELTNAINQEIDDMTSETGSYATGTTVAATPSGRQSSTRLPKIKPLRLTRSKHHKMSFDLEGLSADVVVFPPSSGEVENSIDVRIKKLEVFDHLPTSTWRKFATYMHEAGEREVDTPQVHIELLNVKPMADLAASEMVLKLSVLPLRLHVDQDALDFMARFFEFKDERVGPPTTPSTPLFIQRAEINPIRLKLDFKPKRVDYRGLRSGRTTELMNFLVLDRADMVLRRVILYGVPGLERLGIMLNNIWSPDVRKNQLPGVLAGLAPIRSLVDVGSGVKDLIAIPIREYRKDGRVVRSIQKGAVAFAKTTTAELLGLGAKLAIGTQQVLQNTEEMLVPQQDLDGDEDVERKKQISLYADQPVGIVQGLRGAYASLERDLLLAKDAVVAVPGEFMAASTATGAARAVLRQSPTIILRPAIGATRAIGQTLLGAGNTLNRGNLRRVEDKYKRH